MSSTNATTLRCGAANFNNSASRSILAVADALAPSVARLNSFTATGPTPSRSARCTVANSPTPIRSFREYPCVVNTSSASSAGAAVVEAFRRGRFCHQPRRRLNKFDLFVVVDDDVVVVVFVVALMTRTTRTRKRSMPLQRSSLRNGTKKQL
jgi:hypothetical protein